VTAGPGLAALHATAVIAQTARNSSVQTASLQCFWINFENPVFILGQIAEKKATTNCDHSAQCVNVSIGLIALREKKRAPISVGKWNKNK